MKKIFINYSRTHDANSAEKLYAFLSEQKKLKPWMDTRDMPAGMSWKPEMLREVRDSDFFICLLSEESIQEPGERNREIYEALDWKMRFPPNQIYLIPALVNDCEPPFEEMNKINQVKLFPDWKNGCNNLLTALSEKKTVKAASKNATAKRYHSRVGLVDLDMGLTNLAEIGTQLNNIQRYFLFSCPQMPVLKKCTKVIDGIKNFVVSKAPESYISEHSHLQIDLLACITKYPLAFAEGSNFFAGESPQDDRFLFLSADNLYDYCKQADCSFEEGLVSILTGQLVGYFTEIDYHDETRGCPMDFCENRDDIVDSLRSKKFCKECLRQLPDEIKHPLQQLLQWSYV